MPSKLVFLKEVTLDRLTTMASNREKVSSNILLETIKTITSGIGRKTNSMVLEYTYFIVDKSMMDY